jgi:hypothetical protein
VSTLAQAVDRGDLDELTRWVERLCAARDWDGLLDLRDRCTRALERGRQLWPIASHAEYRLALEAPGRYAAAVLVEGAGHLTLGPLPEVAASSHTWAELAPHVVPGPVAALAAHERVVHGEDLAGAGIAYADVLAVPLRLEPWEPAYLTVRYRPGGVELPGPPRPRGRPLDLPGRARRTPDDEAVRALVDVVRAWTVGSAGRVRAVAVDGDAPSALAALGVGEARVAPLAAAEALLWLAWAGASGGRHGRRRGAARGRDAAWAALGALAGFGPSAFPEAGELGAAADELRFSWWEAPDAPSGFVLRLAVEDPAEGLAWAIDAVDPA